MRRAWFALLLVGCYAPEVVPGGRCGEDGACPAPLVCVADRCELPGAVHDAMNDSSLPPPIDATVDASIDASVGCPATFIEVPPLPNRYLPRNGTRTYAAARADCAMAGGYLVVPSSTLEIQFVMEAMAGDATWLGIDDIVTEGTYIAADTLAPATFLPWQPNEPDNDTTADPAGQDCVQLYMADDQLDDDYCTKTKRYFCECTP